MDAPTLDRSGEPWVGVFPGLGRVEVASDGSVVATAEPVPDDVTDTVDLRETALRDGWGEPLSLVRRGFTLFPATAACSGDAALLLTGDGHEIARIVGELADLDWQFLADRITPTIETADGWLAHPRQAPILMSERRSRKLDLSARQVRGDTDTVAVAVPRRTVPAPIRAVVVVRRRGTSDPRFEELAGHRRFEAVAGLPLGGVLGPADDDLPPAHRAARSMTRQLRLAQLPVARLHCSRDADSVATETAELVAWWERVA